MMVVTLFDFRAISIQNLKKTSAFLSSSCFYYLGAYLLYAREDLILSFLQILIFIEGILICLHECSGIKFLCLSRNREEHLPTFRREHIQFHRYRLPNQHLFFQAFPVIGMRSCHKRR